MNKILRNFWLDVLLFLLLGFNIIATMAIHPQEKGALPGMAVHVHAISGMLMTLGCLAHVGLHWQWVKAVLTGKAKGRVKLFMILVVTVMMLLAGLSGPGAHVSEAAAGFHSFTSSMALIGLFLHGVKHIRWMAMMSKRLFSGSEKQDVIQSA